MFPSNRSLRTVRSQIRADEQSSRESRLERVSGYLRLNARINTMYLCESGDAH